MKIIDQVKQWVHGGKKQFDEVWEADTKSIGWDGRAESYHRNIAWQIFQLQVELEDLRKNLKKE